MSAKMNFKCHGCEERAPGCHSTCEKYKDDRATLEQRKKQERLNKLADTYQQSFHNRVAAKDAKNKLKKERYYAKGKTRD
jgi:hypothetical protein